MKYAASLALGLSLLTVPALAADWTVDAAKSHIAFSGTQTGDAFTGQFKSWSAKIAFDPANPAAGHAEVAIDIASAATGDKQRDEAMPQGEWFDAKKFPQAKYDAKSFRSLGGNQYEAVGSLTIKGVTKDVVVPFTLAVSGDSAHAQGKLKIDRTAFKVGEGPWSTGAYVGTEIALDIDLLAKK